jgi:protein-arginine kinase activator protein McsA
MKIKKYKNGTIKITAQNKRDSNDLMSFLGGCAGPKSNFAKKAEENSKCPKCGSTNTKMLDFENNSCNDCNAVYNVFEH